jgi:hypothetical protein
MMPFPVCNQPALPASIGRDTDADHQHVGIELDAILGAIANGPAARNRNGSVAIEDTAPPIDVVL